MCNKEKKKATILRWIAGYLMCAGVAYVIAAATGSVESQNPGDAVFGAIVMFLVGVGGGTALLLYAGKVAKRGALLAKYAPAVFQKGLEDLEQIAAVSGTDYTQTVKDLQLLYSMGLLQDRYFDHQANKLVRPEKDKQEDRENVSVLVCPNCGATNRIADNEPEICEYCEAAL